MQSIWNSLHLDSGMHWFTACRHIWVLYRHLTHSILTSTGHVLTLSGPISHSLLCKHVYFLKCASHLDSPATMRVPQRRRPESWLQSFSMMKWYRFPQTGWPLHPATQQTHQTQDSIADAVLLYGNSIWQGRLNQSWLWMWKQQPNNSLTRRKLPENLGETGRFF
jgi:hypothetical protein